MSDPLLFLLAVLTILGTPGPTNTLLATSGAAVGLRSSLPLLLGELFGYLIAIGAMRLVLGPVIAAYPPLAAGLKLAVAGYLLWLAIRLWLRSATLAGSGRVTVINVFVTALLNPKALIFALSVFPMSHPGLHWYFLAFTVLVLTAGSSWVLIGKAVGAAAGRHAGLVPRVASVALAGFAGLVAASGFG